MCGKCTKQAALKEDCAVACCTCRLLLGLELASRAQTIFCMRSVMGQDTTASEQQVSPSRAVKEQCQGWSAGCRL